MALARKIAYNVIFNSFLKVFSTVVLSLLSIRLITGYLGQEGFGAYSTILAFFALFSSVADLGLSSVTAREISRAGADEAGILSKVLSLRLVSSCTLFLIAPLFVILFHYPNDVKIGIIIASGAVIFSTLSLFLNGIFQKRLAMDKVALIEFCGKLLQVLAVMLVVHFDLGFLAIVTTFLVSLCFNATTVFFFSRRYVTFTPQINVSFWKEFLRESLPMGATAIITFTYFKMDTIILSMFQSSAHVGIYNVAYKVMENLIFFPAMLVGLILPLLSRYIFSDRTQFQEIADKTFKVFCIIIVPLVAGTYFLAPDIIRFVSGDSFSESVVVLRILVFALGCIFFGQFFTMLLVVGNVQAKLMQLLIIVAVLNISFNIVLIPRYSYIGAASTSVATEMLVVMLTSFLAYKYVGYKPSFKHLEKILFAGCLMSGILFLLAPVSFFLAGSVSVGVYISFLWISRAVSADELASLFSRRDVSNEVAIDASLV
ncbi:MAG: flippase [Minisyncoccota bacterium]